MLNRMSWVWRVEFHITDFASLVSNLHSQKHKTSVGAVEAVSTLLRMTCNVAMSACEKAEQWQQLFVLLDKCFACSSERCLSS